MVSWGVHPSFAYHEFSLSLASFFSHGGFSAALSPPTRRRGWRGPPVLSPVIPPPS